MMKCLDCLKKKQVQIPLVIVSSLLGVLDLFKILPITPFRGALFFLFLILALELFLTSLAKKKPLQELHFLKKLLLFVGVLEMTVFQFNSFHLLGGNYPEHTLSLDSAVIENLDTTSRQNISEGNTSIEFTGINVPIGTLTLDLESSTKSSVYANISISDDTFSALYRNNIANATVLQGHERTQTVPCNFSGTVRNLKITFHSDNGEYITVNKIRINQPINFHFSPLRCLIFLVIGMVLYLLIYNENLKKNYANNKSVVNKAAGYFTLVLTLAALLLTNAGRYADKNHSIDKDFKAHYGNQITQEIVDAFESGHTYLTGTPSPALLQLENPYDDSQRATNETGGYAWDHLLYDGKYYSYYGIGSVITLFWPYYKLTGCYFPSSWAVFLFGILGIIFLTKLYLCFMEKFFGSIRSSNILAGLVLMQMVTGIWFCFNVPNFYEIAQTSGFVCVTAGAFCLLSSNVIGDGKIKRGRLALSSVLLSLAVLCRATTAVYCICALIFIFAGFLKLKESNPKNRSKAYTTYLLCALLPYAVIGAGQMIYNYVRFGSFLEFGIQYSLTINDFTHSQYHTHFVLIGLFNYLFAIPKFMPRFPFFDFSAVETFNPQGYYFVATSSSCGLIWKALPVLALCKAGSAYRTSESKHKKLYAVMILAVSVLAPFAVMYSIWESGYGARYCVDFAWQILIGALVVAFTLYQKCQENTKRHLSTAMAVSSVLSVLLVFAQTYNWVLGSMSQQWQANAHAFARLFEFWI